MQKILVGAVVVVVIIFGGIYMMNTASQDKALMLAEQATIEERALMEKEEMEKAKMMKTDEAMMDEAKMLDEEVDMMKTDAAMMGDEMMKKEDQVMVAEDSMMKKAGLYAPYEASKLAMANSGDVVLFFKASWCPSCRALDSNIKANLDLIPSNLTILELDYDATTALKQQYGVTTQHTLVQVDANGTLIKKWSGGSTVASIVEQVQ